MVAASLGLFDVHFGTGVEQRPDSRIFGACEERGNWANIWKMMEVQRDS
jgi:hypothetical protein